MTPSNPAGTLHVVGMGPGDPELLTLMAVRRLRESPVIAFFAKRGRQGHARRIATEYIPETAVQLRFEYPYTTEITVDDPLYEPAMTQFYQDSATTIESHLTAGQNVALLCEGDPFFYGSAMYLFDRLRTRFPTSVTPGISAMSGCWSAAQTPMTHGDDILTVIPGTMDQAALTTRLQNTDAAVIMKVGSNLAKIRTAVAAAGLNGRATLVEHGSMPGQRLTPLADAPEAAPYFSLVLIPGRQRPR
jgi:precorrin-2/cobalt-factor-2 C20-methyltransferase